jgi:hypothetical protein
MPWGPSCPTCHRRDDKGLFESAVDFPSLAAKLTSPETKQSRMHYRCPATALRRSGAAYLASSLTCTFHRRDDKGLFESASDFPSLAAKLNLPEAALRKTIEEYGTACDLGIDVVTLKNAFPVRMAWGDRDLVAARVTPSIHYTVWSMAADGVKTR